MATTTFQPYTGDGTDKTFVYSFPTFASTEIVVEIDGVVVDNFTIPDYQTTGTRTVTFDNSTGTLNATVCESDGAPKSGLPIIIRRDTNIDAAKATFVAGASLKADDLNNNTTQYLRALQEEQNTPVTTPRLNSAAVTTAKLKDAAVSTAKLADSSVTSAKIADGTIVNADINANAAIDASKIVSSSGSVAGTMSSANFTKLAGIEAGATADQTDAEIRTAVENASDSNVFTDNDHSKLNGIEPNATADQTAAEIRTLVESASDSNVFTDADHTKLNSIEASATADQTAAEIKTLLQSDKLTSSEIATGTLDGRYFTETELNAGQLDNRYFTETELTNGALDGRYYTETEAEAKFLRQDSTETIASGVSWSNSDSFVATTAAINARILDLVDDVGGFTAIANQTSFPATNPQGTTGQAAILSIAATTATLTPSGTTITIANGAGTGNTVTITGVSSAIPSGFGFLVQSTSTTHTYTFHRLVPKATEVTTVASNITNINAAGANVADINNFADIYQISSSAPTQRADGSSLQEGDLWYDSSNDNLLVYTGSAFSIITPSQSVLDDVAIVSGAITFQEDLGLITNAVTTGSSNGSLDLVADALEDEITFAVTVISSGGNKYVLDGDTANPAKALSLHKGWTYTFDQSDSSNANHPLRFKTDAGSYTTNVTATGTPGQAGAKTVIQIPESQPTGFRYYCTVHGNGMGNTITVIEDPIKGVADNVTNINSVATNATNINTVAGAISNVNTVAGSIGDVNRYANEYIISASQPSSPSEGDLWFDTTNNVLQNYNGTAWLGITSNSGISSVVADTSPELGGNLDCNNRNLTEVGTVSGDNLQLDFGTLT